MKILKTVLAILAVLVLLSQLVWYSKPEWFVKDGVRVEEVFATEHRSSQTGQTAVSLKTVFDASVNHQKNEKEYQDSATLSIDFPPLRETEDYLALTGKIDFLADREHFFRKNTTIDGLEVETDYILHNNRALKITRTRPLDAAKYRLLTTVYRYAAGRPLDALITLNELETADPQSGVNTYRQLGSQIFIWQADGTLWRESKADAALAEYTADHCAACYREALELGKRAAEEQRQEQYARDMQQQSNRVAANKGAYVQLNDVAAIMPKGMKHNSLVVGYDRQGLPEKIYYSYDNGRRRQSFEYYLNQGTVFQAQSSTVALAADGITADTSADHRKQKWTLENGKIIEEKTGFNGKLPDYPLSKTMIENEPKRLAAAAIR